MVLRLWKKIRAKTREELVRALRWRIMLWAAKTFGVGLQRRRPVMRTFVPDSVWVFDAHPEIRGLASRFFDQNASNRGDQARLLAFVLNIKQVLKEGVPGDFAELGVWRGNTAAILAHYAAAAGRSTLLFDTFEGFPQQDLSGFDAHETRNHFADTSIARVAAVIGTDAGVEYVPGYFPDTITDQHRNRQYAVVSLDCDLYAPMRAGLAFFYPRLSPGGLLLLHDYSSGCWPGAAAAIDAFCAETGARLVLQPDKSGSAFVRKL